MYSEYFKGTTQYVGTENNQETKIETWRQNKKRVEEGEILDGLVHESVTARFEFSVEVKMLRDRPTLLPERLHQSPNVTSGSRFLLCAPLEAAADNPGSLVPGTLRKKWIEFSLPAFSLAQPWPLQIIEEWTNMCEISPAWFCFCVSLPFEVIGLKKSLVLWHVSIDLSEESMLVDVAYKK